MECFTFKDLFSFEFSFLKPANFNPLFIDCTSLHCAGRVTRAGTSQIMPADRTEYIPEG